MFPKILKNKFNIEISGDETGVPSAEAKLNSGKDINMGTNRQIIHKQCLGGGQVPKRSINSSSRRSK